MYANIALPNLITVARLIAVPLVVVSITEERLDAAFWLFVVAGASDGVDGWIARRWNLRTRLGAYLDAIADKALLVAIYVTLGVEGILARWLVILVASRDLLIVGAFLLSWVMARPVEVRPLMISKINTTGQILLAGTILGEHAFAIDLSAAVQIGIWVVAALTVASGAAYLATWLKAMSAEPGAGSGPAPG